MGEGIIMLRQVGCGAGSGASWMFRTACSLALGGWMVLAPCIHAAPAAPRPA